MLKIKDNVDLKELEKFGFEKDENDGYYKYWLGNTQVFSIAMWNGNIIIIQTNISPNGEGRSVGQEILGILYDLIQARISRESRGVKYERRRDN